MAQTITNRGNHAAVASTTNAVTPSGSVANGSNLVMTIGYLNGTAGKVSSITQSGATWVQKSAQSNATGGTTSEVWVAENVSGVGTNAATVNFGSSLSSQIQLMEVTGSATSSSIDKTATSQGNDGGGFPTTGTTSATTMAAEIAIGVITLDVSGAIASADNGYTVLSDLNVSVPHMTTVYKILSATGTTGTTLAFSFTPVSYNWAGALVTMKGSAGAQGNQNLF